jgi:hypothetical protein
VHQRLFDVGNEPDGGVVEPGFAVMQAYADRTNAKAHEGALDQVIGAATDWLAVHEDVTEIKKAEDGEIACGHTAHKGCTGLGILPTHQPALENLEIGVGVTAVDVCIGEVLVGALCAQAIDGLGIGFAMIGTAERERRGEIQGWLDAMTG